MKVKELLDRPERWTKGAIARRADGCMTSVEDRGAVCWCLWGAMVHCYGFPIAFGEIIGKTAEHVPAKGEPHQSDVTLWNDQDDRTFEEVKALVDELDI